MTDESVFSAAKTLVAPPTLGNPWQAERRWTEAEIRRRLARRFPALAQGSLRPLGDGWDNSAWLADESWVFRFPRRQVAVPLLRREVSLLPWLAHQLPLAVPVPCWVDDPPMADPTPESDAVRETRPPTACRHPDDEVAMPVEGNEWPGVGYPLLTGTTACVAHLSEAQRLAAAVPLAQFLRGLHGLSVPQARSRGAADDEWGRLDIPRRLRQAEMLLAEVRGANLLSSEVMVGIWRLLNALATTPPEKSRPQVLVHGDLYSRHILVDEQCRPCGIIDWGDIHLGDPAVDLALAFILLPRLAWTVFRNAYGRERATNDTWRLAAFRAAVHSLNCLRYAGAIGDGPLRRESTEALVRLAAAGAEGLLGDES